MVMNGTCYGNGLQGNCRLLIYIFSVQTSTGKLVGFEDRNNTYVPIF